MHGASGRSGRRTRPKVAPGLVIAPCERMLRITDLDYAMPWDLGKRHP